MSSASRLVFVDSRGNFECIFSSSDSDSHRQLQSIFILYSQISWSVRNQMMPQQSTYCFNVLSLFEKNTRFGFPHWMVGTSCSINSYHCKALLDQPTKLNICNGFIAIVSMVKCNVGDGDKWKLSMNFTHLVKYLAWTKVGMQWASLATGYCSSSWKSSNSTVFWAAASSSFWLISI